MVLFFIILSSIILSFCVYLMLISDPLPIKGVYRQRGKWFYLKYFLFRVLFWLRQRQNKNLKLKEAKCDNAGYGLRSRSSPDEMDKVQNLNVDFPQAVDAVYFNGGNPDGIYIVTATARRHNNLTQSILILRLPGIGIVEIPTQPDTNLVGEENQYSAGGLKLQPVEVMKKWHISFDGKLRIKETDKIVTASFDLDWTAITEYFDFDTDLNPAVMSDAIARERWSREYFHNLQKAHQTHYEQFGEIIGRVNIEGYSPVDIKVQGVRDHSYGNIRDWKNLDRYCIQYIHCKDGVSACIGCICMPITMSRLVIGYIFKSDGTMENVSETDFEFYKVGDDGNPPKEMSFNFKAGNTTYKLDIEVVDAPIFYMGVDWDVKIHERFCRFKLNGVEGWGISEWEYRNLKGRSDVT